MISDNLFRDYPEVIFMISFFYLFMLQSISMFKYKIYYDRKENKDE